MCEVRIRVKIEALVALFDLNFKFRVGVRVRWRVDGYRWLDWVMYYVCTYDTMDMSGLL